MKAAITWMARNHVAANMLMLLLIVGGIFKAFTIKQEVFPEVDMDLIQVSVAYPGAGPEEVEEGIVLKIEEALTGVDGIKEVKSVAREGTGTVTAEIRLGEDIELILQDIKSAVDRIITFPEDAEKPMVSKSVNRSEVISVIVYGDASERSLREQAESIRDELLALHQITQVDLAGVRPYEISIEISEANLRQYNLTIEQVAQRIKKASLDLPGGIVKTSGGEILLRTKERRYFGLEYADTVIVVTSNGSEVRLGDIATVRDTFRDTDVFSSFDGKPAAMVKVFRVGNQKPIEIAKLAKAYVEEKRARLPTSLNVATWNDSSEIFSSRMNLLIKNAVLGLILVIIILSLFLEIKLALWVMLGIPISFLGAIFLMPMIDVSINMLSLFAFIMALGIVVDDAIIVGENIYEHRQRGKPYLQAAIDGANEVFIPVTFSVLTTITAFIPLIFVVGMLGKFIKVIPLIAIAVIFMSLVESLFVLPAHLTLGGANARRGRIISAIDKVRDAFDTLLKNFISKPYKKFLTLCIRYRYSTLAVGIAALLLTVGAVKGGAIKFAFFPHVEGDIITASVKMPPGTPAEKTRMVQADMVSKAMDVVAEFDESLPEGDTVLRNVFSIVGGKLSGHGPGASGETTGGNEAQIALLLTKSEHRDISSDTIGYRWRDVAGEVPGAESVTFSTGLMSLGIDIDIQLSHNDFSVLAKASERIKETLEEYPGVGDIQDNYSKGKQELKIKLKGEARTLSVTETDLGRQIRAAFYGAEALRIQRGRNEVRVMVRYPEEDRKSLWDFERMRIRTPMGGEIPLARAATVEFGRGFSEINRTERKRVINITADVNENIISTLEIVSDLKQGLLPELVNDYPGLIYSLVGEERERQESLGSMGTGFIMALVAIFALLAIPLRSYSQPLLIMAAIPFGIVGAIIGHFIMGFTLSILSMFGVVALSGVVINDSLLLIHRVNHDLRQGANLHEAVIDAGQRRFRPILLTSLTTFFGLMPMMMETSVQAQFLIPMAISLAFGILFATIITLLLIPSLYIILEDIRKLLGLDPIHSNMPEDTQEERN